MSTAADGHRRGFGDVKAVWIIGAVFDISGEPSDVDSALFEWLKKRVGDAQNPR
jgi:hypothetical protein